MPLLRNPFLLLSRNRPPSGSPSSSSACLTITRGLWPPVSPWRSSSCSSCILLLHKSHSLFPSTHLRLSDTGADPSRSRIPMTAADESDHDHYLLAVSYFEGKEYARCMRTLSNSIGPRCAFLSLYARYLLGEKKRDEDRLEASGPLGRPQGANTELDAVESGCQVAMASLKRQGVNSGEDPFLLYLRGLALSDLQRTDEAIACLARSLHLYPCNWGAWQALVVRIYILILTNLEKIQQNFSMIKKKYLHFPAINIVSFLPAAVVPFALLGPPAARPLDPELLRSCTMPRAAARCVILFRYHLTFCIHHPFIRQLMSHDLLSQRIGIFLNILYRMFNM